ncbi:hypothetical protein PENTCL1PPCAC_13654, partial [Pristionchus entomophagus]
MVLFLEAIYPPMTGFGNRRLGQAELQVLLELADRFMCSTVTAIVETFLMGEKIMSGIEMPTSRFLLLCDKYKLSAPMNQALHELEEYGNLDEIQSSSDFKEMSKALTDLINNKKDFLEHRFSENLKSVKMAIEPSDSAFRPLEIAKHRNEKLNIALDSLRPTTPEKLWAYREWRNLCTTLNELAVLLHAETRDVVACESAAKEFLDTANTIVIELNM